MIQHNFCICSIFVSSVPVVRTVDDSYERRLTDITFTEMGQEGPPTAPPSSSQAVKKRRATVNEDLKSLVETHFPHLNYQQVASPNFDMDLLNNEHVEKDARAKIKHRRRQVGPTIEVPYCVCHATFKARVMNISPYSSLGMIMGKYLSLS